MNHYHLTPQVKRVPFSTLFDEFFGTETSPFWTVPVNTFEYPESFEIQLSLPGWQKSEINIALKENVLTLSGEHTAPANKPSDKAQVQFKKNNFSKKFKIPAHVDVAQIQAHMEHGILTLTMPKSVESTQATHIPIM